MSTIKRVTALIMAVLLCIPMCFFGASAYSQKEYFDDYDALYGESGKSFGLVSISNYGEADFRTDLEVATQAYNFEYYEDGICSTTVEVYAFVDVTLSDYTTVCTSDFYTAGSDEPIARIRLFGRELMDGEHYILGFTTSHSVTVEKWEYNSNSGRYDSTYIYSNTFGLNG